MAKTWNCKPIAGQYQYNVTINKIVLQFIIGKYWLIFPMNRGWASFILCNKICKIKMFTWLKRQSVILHKRMGNMMDGPILKPAPLSPNFKLLNSVLKEKCMNLSSKLWLEADSLTREKLVTVWTVPLNSPIRCFTNWAIWCQQSNRSNSWSMCLQ